MSLQTKPAGCGPHSCIASISPGEVPVLTNKTQVSSFLHRVNPVNWFNEFSKISITLEEFAPAKPRLETGNKKSG